MKNYNVPAELLDLIPGYLKRRDLEIADLNMFLQNKDFESIEKVGHKLKGNGSSFGFDLISQLGELIMIAAHNKNAVEVKKLIDELQNEVSHIKVDSEVDFSE